jgi:hypothetical protein
LEAVAENMNDMDEASPGELVVYSRYCKGTKLNLMHVLGPSVWLWCLPIAEDRRRAGAHLGKQLR